MDRSAWDGKYVMTGHKNLDGFLSKLGVPAETIKAIQAMQINLELSHVGDDYTMKQTCGEKENIIKVTVGKECLVSTIDGIKLKGVLTFDDNNDIRGKYEGGFEGHMTLSKDGVMTDTTTIDGVSVVRTYKRA